jgi:hypothetical protein
VQEQAVLRHLDHHGHRGHLQQQARHRAPLVEGEVVDDPVPRRPGAAADVRGGPGPFRLLALVPGRRHPRRLVGRVARGVEPRISWPCDHPSTHAHTRLPCVGIPGTLTC